MGTDQNAVDSILSAGWCILPKRILFDPGLTNKEKLLYAFISSYTAQRGYAFASNAYLAKKFGCTVNWISACINNIKRRGYFRIILIRDKFTDEVKQRRIYLASPNISDVNTPSPTFQGGVSQKNRGGTPEKAKYNKKRRIKREEEEDAPPPPVTYQPKKLTAIVQDIFHDTDPDLKIEGKALMAAIHVVFQTYDHAQIVAAHQACRADKTRRAKGETGFDYLFDSAWQGKYAVERIGRYAKIAAVRTRQRDRKDKESSGRIYTPPPPLSPEEQEKSRAAVERLVSKFRHK